MADRDGAPSAPALAVFAAAVFTSATLLFFVQPMVGRLLLPLFGGAAAVWITCLVFFQAALLAGYLYADVVARRLPARRQAAVHLVVLLCALAVLPIHASPVLRPGGESAPVRALLLQLLTTVGLPFVALAGTGTLLQSWFARSGDARARDPYFLYAASNLGSLLALLAYPFLVEPRWGLRAQGRGWTFGYVVLIALVAVAAWRLPRGEEPKASPPAGGIGTLSRRRRVRWVACSFVPGSLMMGVTLFLTTDIAPVPLLWVVPLALYLFAFVIAFGRMPRLGRALALLAVPSSLLLVYFTFSEIRYPMAAEVSLHLGTMFLLSVAYLGRLVEDRPAPEHLTGFYLLIALGGVLAGVFNALVAPVVFRTAAEYGLVLAVATGLLPLVLGASAGQPYWPRDERRVAELSLAVAVALLTAWMVGAWPLTAIDFGPLGQRVGFPRWRVTTILTYAVPVAALAGLYVARRWLAFGLAVVAFAGVCTYDNERGRAAVHRERSFYSVLSVRDDAQNGCRTLWSGTTPHGRQRLTEEGRREPLQFYHRDSPVGQVIAELKARGGPRQLAIVGLGTGALAAYGEPGDAMVFYEIDPAVARVALDPELFRYVSDSRAEVKIVLGDGRLRLSEEPRGRFDLIVVDAFSSDAIPVHLLTREALGVFLDKLAPRGLIAYHISNRYLDLAAVVARLSREQGLVALDQTWRGDDGCASPFSTRWVVLGRAADDFGKLAEVAGWSPLTASAGERPWTDDFSSLLEVWR